MTSDAGAAGRDRPLLFLVLPVLLVVGLVSCSGADSTVEWRNITFDVPDGWVVLDSTDDLLTIASAEVVEQEDRPDEGEDVVALYMTFEPGVVPDDWRRYVVEQDATLESDDAILVGGDVPATRLVFSSVQDGIAVREMVIVIPSRSVVVLAQPVARPGTLDATAVLLEELDTLLAIVVEARYGAPRLD